MLVWYHQIDDAKSPHEVVAVARDYLASWGPQELSLIPEAIRPGRVRDEQDVEFLHGELIEEYRGTKATGDALDALQRMTSFMVRAVIRIAELREDRPMDARESPAPASKKSLAPRGG
jgi:hypothetical protein